MESKCSTEHLHPTQVLPSMHQVTSCVLALPIFWLVWTWKSRHPMRPMVESVILSTDLRSLCGGTALLSPHNGVTLVVITVFTMWVYINSLRQLQASSMEPTCWFNLFAHPKTAHSGRRDERASNGKGDNLCQQHISSYASRTCRHTRVDEVEFTWAESETVDTSCERSHEAANSSSGLKKHRSSFDWRAKIWALPRGEHLLCTSRGIRRQQCQTELVFSALSLRKYHCAAKRTIKVKRKSVAASPGLLGSVGRKYEPNHQKEGKVFSKEAAALWFSSHSFFWRSRGDFYISVVHISCAFLLPVDNVAQIGVVIDAITTTNGWRT